MSATITVGNNKLILSEEAIKLLNISPGDRIIVNYFTVDPEETFPIICKSTDDLGNKLTKSKTVSFRGEQRDILLWYGSVFTLEPFKGFFMMKASETNSNA